MTRNVRVAVVASAQIFGGFQNLPPPQSLDFSAFFGLSHLFPPRPFYSHIFDTDLVTSHSGAQSDAQEAISVLQSLLTLGFDAMDAAAMLNELYVLRGDGCFSTVDLLEMDLCTGEGALYKWGAAPSYLKKGGTVKKIGTASPPPGLGVGEEHRAERVGLSLQRGEQLVLTTDGIPEAACEQYLRACGPLSPRELAAGVVACASESEPDDRTAVIVQLDPASMQPHHTTRRARSMSKTGAEPHI